MSLFIENLDCGKYDSRLECHKNECKHQYEESYNEYHDLFSAKILGGNVVQTKDGDPNHTHCYNDDPGDNGLRTWVKKEKRDPISRREFRPPYPWIYTPDPSLCGGKQYLAMHAASVTCRGRHTLVQPRLARASVRQRSVWLRTRPL